MNADERGRTIEQRKEKTDRFARLWCKDEWKDFPIYRVPVDALLLNADNRRFAAERKLAEEQLGHSLDPENSQADEQSIIAILLDTNFSVDGDTLRGKATRDTEALKDDWLRRKQESPFWIRPDGTVHNGNRRLAMLKRLRLAGIEGTEWVDAIILDPSDVDELDLFEMEQREQLTEDFKVRYTDINLLLALRDAANARGIDWADEQSITKVAGELQGVAGGDQDYALIQLRAIRYMDEYLKDSNAQGQYQRLLRQVERFRDVGKAMARIERDYPDSAADMLRTAFAAIRAGNTHDDIRALLQMLRKDRPRFETLLKQIEEDEKEWEATGPELANPELTSPDGTEDDDNDGTEAPGPVVPRYPKEKVRTRITNAIDGFRAAGFDVASILEQVQNRLDALMDERRQLEKALREDSDGAVRKALGHILEWSEKVRSSLPKE
jgi:hypothetical protein